MSFIPKPHEIYKHFKGNLYQITAIAEHSETGEQLVVYQALYGDFKTYARPLSMFVEKVDRKKYPDAEQIFRFELQGTDEQRRMSRLREADMADSGQAEPAGQKQPEAAQQSRQQAEPAGQKQPEAAPQNGQQSEPAQEMQQQELDPMLLEFLDADSYEDRLNILAGLHHKITDEMITTMALACDIEVKEGELEQRYAELRSCLLTLERFECNRLR